MVKLMRDSTLKYRFFCFSEKYSFSKDKKGKVSESWKEGNYKPFAVIPTIITNDYTVDLAIIHILQVSSKTTSKH